MWIIIFGIVIVIAISITGAIIFISMANKRAERFKAEARKMIELKERTPRYGEVLKYLSIRGNQDIEAADLWKQLKEH